MPQFFVLSVGFVNTMLFPVIFLGGGCWYRKQNCFCFFDLNLSLAKFPISVDGFVM